MIKKWQLFLFFVATLFGLALGQLTFFNALAQGSTPTGTINLDPATKYQTIIGWEATAQASEPGQNPGDVSPIWNSYKDYLFDQAVSELGINRLRVEVQAVQADVPDSPFDLNKLDNKIDYIVLPMKQRIEANGENLWINVVVVGNELDDNPALYAQETLRVYRHLQSKYGLVPNSWEVALEPDVFGWNSALKVGNAMIAAGDLLKASGFQTYFVAPSTTDQLRAINYFNTIITMPKATDYLKELSYHLYTNVSDANRQTIGQLGIQYNINTSQLEKIGADYNELHKDLKLARNSAWQQYTLAYHGTNDNGGAYYLINDGAPTPQSQVVMGSSTKFLRQYFKFIRKGAQRIEAISQDANFDPLAFTNSNGKYVVVVKAINGGPFSIRSLPEGTYGITYTTSNQYNFNHPDQTITAGQLVSTEIPNSGVITIYQKATPAPTASPVITPTPTPSASPNPTPAPTPTPTPQPANPSIQLTYPLQGMNAQLGSQMTLLATASSGKGVNRVEFQVNGNTICTDSAAPYACDWRVSATSATYKITAWVIDNAGSKKSETITVTAGPNIYPIPTPTTLSILSPANNSKVAVGSKAEVKADASDTQSGINRVVMMVNGSSICTDSTTPYSCNWIVPQGSGKNYTLAVYAITNAGNKVSRSITVASVPNLFPTVTIANPLDGAEVAAGSWVVIKAVAQSTQSEVSRVVFQVNGSHVCTDYEAPYICNWIVPPVSGINYNITAWAFNKSGNRQSGSISVRSRFGY